MKLNKKSALERPKPRKYNIELGFISKLLETKDMKLLKDLNIKSFFLTGDNKRVFKYIQKTFRETGEVPTCRIIEQKFPNYELETYNKDGNTVVGTEETLLYWCTELRTKAKHNKMADALESIAEMLTDGNTEEAYSEYKKNLWQIESEIEETDNVDVTKNIEDRKQAYLEKKKNKGVMGIPTGIPHLDYILKGLIDETLTTIMADTGVGKTWLLVLIACYAQLQGYKVLFFLTEMSSDIMQDRIEAMLYGMVQGKFNYGRFKAGALSPQEEADYFDFLDNVLPNLEPMILETATNVSGVVATYEMERPDLILIDGAYLMEDDECAKEDWARITHVTRALKRVAKRIKKPIIINAQADLKRSKKGSPTLGDIKYAQAIIQDSDNVLALYRDEVMIADSEMGITVRKNREGTLGKVVLNWDFKTMNFDSIYSETDGNSSQEDSSDDEEENDAIIEIE